MTERPTLYTERTRLTGIMKVRLVKRFFAMLAKGTAICLQPPDPRAWTDLVRYAFVCVHPRLFRLEDSVSG